MKKDPFLKEGEVPPASASIVQICAAALTLAATLLGGGGAVVPIEDTVRYSGYVLSPFLFVVGGIWTVYTSWVLLKTSLVSGEPSYEAIAMRTLGPVGSYLVQGEILVNAFLICVSVLGLFCDFLLVVYPFDKLPRPAMVTIGGVIVLPLTALVRRVDRLAPMSLVTAITALVFLGFVIAKAATSQLPGPEYQPGPSGNEASRVWLDALSTITIAFVIQFNVLPVYQSLPPTDAYGAMLNAVLLGTSLVFVVYVLTETLSHITFGLDSYDNIITAYGNMPGGSFMSVQLGIGQLISYPIMAHAAVTQLSTMLGSTSAAIRRWEGDTPVQHKRSSHVESRPAESSTLLKAADDDVSAKTWGLSQRRFACVSDLIAGSVYVVLTALVSALLEDTSSVLSVVGALCATPLMIIFPPLMWLRCPEAVAKCGRMEYALHATMTVVGIAITIGGLAVTLVDL